MIKIQPKNLILLARITLLTFLCISSCKERNYSKLDENKFSADIPTVINSELKTIKGLVIGISDGDTFKLLMDNDFSVKVRLNGIDCPEKKQSFSKKAKEALSNLIFQKEVMITYEKKDRYGRVLGDVYVNKLNVNYEMVRMGFAWHYKKYSDDQKLSDIEANARKNRIGLWSDPNPIAPWDYRESRKK